jgi:sterol desaturase/sphingolipid hydroxylase (fatty acid hydroxylase superfamily)
MFNHSNLKLDLRFLESILITPRLHKIHHIYKTSERNLGTVFTFWDRIRGTLVLTETDESIAFGNGEQNYPQSWGAQLIEPARGIARLRRKAYR